MKKENLDDELKQLKITRDKKFNVGKKMGSQLWFHKDYANEIIGEKEFNEFKKEFKNLFDYEVIRWDSKKNEIAFIESVDFLTSNEPLVGRVQRIQKEENSFIMGKLMNQPKDPLIYHHKWLFVKDDFKKFNITESKNRSLEWKNVAGVDRTLSNKIGRLSFWNNWLKENNLKERNENHELNIFLENKKNSKNDLKEENIKRNKNGIRTRR